MALMRRIRNSKRPASGHCVTIEQHWLLPASASSTLRCLGSILGKGGEGAAGSKRLGAWGWGKEKRRLNTGARELVARGRTQ